MFSRYLTSFSPSELETHTYDILVIGSGIAGLWSALDSVERCRVGVITKGPLEESSTRYAQGGIAAALCPQDSPSLHLEDTMVAGAGLCNREAASILVTEGPLRVRELVKRGAHFDEEHGQLILAREGAHGIRRIVRARGDQTGQEVERALVEEVEHTAVDLLENTFAVDLLTQGDECVGVLCWSNANKRLVVFLASATIIATGGAGQLYRVTTNPVVATGDGMAMAYRAGARLQDMEFIQFHPTALATATETNGKGYTPKFLISEAVRGEGARLINIRNERFMPGYHPDAELAPRDVVSTSILQEMQRTQSTHVFLDLTAHSREAIQKRFPSIFQTCQDNGIDPSLVPIPVSPAAHYTMGGVKTGINGETNLKRLFACGEAACTGVHGANRLASNSLLEGLVFGHRAAISALRVVKRTPLAKPELPACTAPRVTGRRGLSAKNAKKALQEIMWNKVGLLRSEKGLREAVAEIDSLIPKVASLSPSPAAWEVMNMLQVGRLIACAALVRTESRGAHRRSDYPDANDAAWRAAIVLERPEEDATENLSDTMVTIL